MAVPLGKYAASAGSNSSTPRTLYGKRVGRDIFRRLDHPPSRSPTGPLGGPLARFGIRKVFEWPFFGLKVVRTFPFAFCNLKNDTCHMTQLS